MTIGLDIIDQLTGRRLGTFDVPCPECGPFKRSPRNQRKLVLRVYRIDPGFAGYHCARCGAKGAARDRNSAPTAARCRPRWASCRPAESIRRR
jgi:hypothetical protein